MSLIVPAVLPSSREDLDEKLAMLVQIPSVSRVQIDIVDGRFASPASWPYFAKATQGTPCYELEAMVQKGEMLPHLGRLMYEIDLMCTDAESVAEAWLALGATRLTFHAESTTNIVSLLEFARRRYGVDGEFTTDMISFGIAINLESDLALIEPCLSKAEYVQFMGISRIGRQGQPFDGRVLEKIKIFHAQHPKIVLQVDGGVSLENARHLIALGISNLVVGSAILNANDPSSAFAKFEALESQYGV